MSCVTHSLVAACIVDSSTNVYGFSHSATKPLKMALQRFSFIFRIDHIAPDWNGQAIQNFNDGGWKPPTWALGLRTVENGRLYRWESGVASILARNDPAYVAVVQHPEEYEYSAGTVFTQAPYSQRFFAVNFDARWNNIDPNWRWEQLMFNHVPHQAGQGFYYSDLGLLRDSHNLATLTNADWQRDLFPSGMRCDGTHAFAQNRRTAGLIGSLPFLLAVIAFSGPRESLADILQYCLRPSQHPTSSQGRWQHFPGQIHGSMPRMFDPLSATLNLTFSRNATPWRCGDGL